MAIDLFDAPVPGQSLTSDPNNPMPFETPPEFTDKQQLIEGLYEQLTSPDSIERVSQLLESGMSVESIVKVILFTGVANGKFNVDMQLLLIEPVVYIILHIAERLGVEPVMEDDEYLSKDVESEIEEFLKEGTMSMPEIKDKVPQSLLAKGNEENI